MKPLFSLTVLACSTGMLLADFSYPQTARVTGGSAAKQFRKEPETATLLVKGNRMVHLFRDTASVVDLDKETTTRINFKKKTYSVTTFEEENKGLVESTLMQIGRTKNDTAQVSFNVSVRETGRSKTIGGADAKEWIVTLVMGGVPDQPAAPVYRTETRLTAQKTTTWET
jgi:hypothetical protein